jgi:hypothetical protein
MTYEVTRTEYETQHAELAARTTTQEAMLKILVLMVLTILGLVILAFVLYLIWIGMSPL